MGLPLITLQPGGNRPPSVMQKLNILAALGGASAASVLEVITTLGTKVTLLPSATAPSLVGLTNRTWWYNTVTGKLLLPVAGQWVPLAGDAVPLTNSLVLAPGAQPYSPDSGFHFRLGSPQDPGTPLNIDGRGQVIHGFSINAGSANFTNQANHAHFIMQNQMGTYWQTLICGELTGQPNRQVTYSRPQGIDAPDYNRPNLTTLDTRGASLPTSPDWTATGFVLNYSNQAVGVSVGDVIDVATNPGIGGLVAGRYPGRVTALVNSGGGTQQVTVQLWNLTPVNFNRAAALAQTEAALVPLSATNEKIATLRKYQGSLTYSRIETRPEIGKNIIEVTFTGTLPAVGASIVLNVLVATAGRGLGLGIGFRDAYVHSALPVEGKFLVSVGSMIASYANQPTLVALTSPTDTTGMTIFLGNTDPVHQPTASMQTQMFERTQFGNNSRYQNGSVHLFNVGPRNECYNSDSFTVGFGNLVNCSVSHAIGHNNIIELGSTEATVVGVNNRLRACSALHAFGSAMTLTNQSNRTILGHGADLLSISGDGLEFSDDNGGSWREVSLREGMADLGPSGDNLVLNLDYGTVQETTLTDDCTIVMPGAPALTGKNFRLDVLGTGSPHTLSFMYVDWIGGSAPRIDTTDQARNVFQFMARVGGGWIGELMGRGATPYIFEINAQGDLILTYQSAPAPGFEIDINGDLILTT